MAKSTARRLKGFRDFLPESMALRKHVTSTFETIFRQYGFLPLETPTLEYAETFEGKSSEEAETLMYKFTDQGDRRVGLRYDLTVPLARVVGMHPDLPIPFKRYHIAPVWRAERPQRGRFREFWQCDVDIVGSAHPAADAEILTILSQCLEAVGFSEYRVLVNNRKVLSALARHAGVEPSQAGHIYRSIDKLNKIGAEGVREEMTERGLSADAAGRVLQLVSLEGSNDDVLDQLESHLAGDPQGVAGVRELRSVLALLPSFGAPTSRYSVDTTLARGLDYYTGIVFESVVDEPKVGSVTGGGRYDDLVGAFAGKELPTVGTSLGLERILEVLEELHLVSAPRVSADVLVSTFNEEHVQDSVALTTRLRTAGLSAETYLGQPGNLRRQLAHADRLNIPAVFVLGPDERARGEVTLRDMASGEQRTVPDEAAAAEVSKLLAALAGR